MMMMMWQNNDILSTTNITRPHRNVFFGQKSKCQCCCQEEGEKKIFGQNDNVEWDYHFFFFWKNSAVFFSCFEIQHRIFFGQTLRKNKKEKRKVTYLAQNHRSELFSIFSFSFVWNRFQNNRITRDSFSSMFTIGLVCDWLNYLVWN